MEVICLRNQGAGVRWIGVAAVCACARLQDARPLPNKWTNGSIMVKVSHAAALLHSSLPPRILVLCLQACLNSSARSASSA
jgi:hypothetical protein